MVFPSEFKSRPTAYRGQEVIASQDLTRPRNHSANAPNAAIPNPFGKVRRFSTLEVNM